MPTGRSGAAGSHRTAMGLWLSVAHRRYCAEVFYASWSKRVLAVEDGAELGSIDVAAGDDADDITLAGQSCHGDGNGRGTGCLGDDVMAAGQETNRIRNLSERRACRVIHHLANQRPHFFQH